MFRNLLTGTAIACALAFGISTGALAQGTDAKDDAKKAGQEAKDAGKDAGHGGSRYRPGPNAPRRLPW